MRFTELRATPDIVGRRIWVEWSYVLDSLDTVDHVPDVLLRRKTRDFEFPPLVPSDPYLAHDSAAFPPAPVPNVLEVRDLPTSEVVEQGLRTVTSAISVAAVLPPGRRQETVRWARAVSHDSSGHPAVVTFRLLDASGVEERTPYYYELDDGTVPTSEEVARYRAVAVAGGTHGANRKLYDLLPAVYTRHDVRLIPEPLSFPGVPEASRSGGQLRRFIDMFGMGVDAMRSSAENLLDLHDAHTTEARFLAGLSSWIGWERTDRALIPAQRNELLSSTRLFDVMGSVPAMRAIVTQQTGWTSQVAEFHQHVWRSNEPARRLVQGMEEVAPGTWRGIDDASTALGFPVGAANGTVALPATIATALLEPFALRSGMELTLVVDGGVPSRVRFGPDDFADISQAAAAEVAAVLGRMSDALDAAAVAGSVELRTRAVGVDTSIEIEAAAATLIGVDGAGDGRPVPVVDPAGRIRVFAERQVIDHPRSARALSARTWAYGEWMGDTPLDLAATQPARPTATMLPDGTCAIAWTELDAAPAERLRMSFGASATASPAVVTGSHRGPFALSAGAQLTLVGSFGTETFVVNAVDYANVNQATAAEVVAAMNAQFAGLTASDVTGAVRLATVGSGTTARLRVDLSQSTAARPLGLFARELRGAGSWDPALQWSRAHTLPLAGGPVDDAALVADPLGGLRAGWAEHHRGAWEIRHAHWSDRITVVTGAGVAQRDASSPWQVWLIADGLPSNVVRGVAVDANGSCWFATPAGVARRRPDGVWTTFTTVDGLASDDVRGVAIDIAGSAVCATPAGVSLVDSAGGVTTLTAGGSGLIDDDVRAVAADPAGGFWAATVNGVSRIDRDDAWTSWTTADGLSAGAPRHIALGAGRRVAVATSGGASILDRGAWVTLTAVEGLPSDDVRGMAWTGDGTLLAATSAGLGRWDGRRWTADDTASGLPTNDLRAVAVTGDERVLLSSAAGLIIGTAGAWTVEDATDGLPAGPVAGAHAGWSAPTSLVAGGGGHRQPALAVDTANRTWLVWSRRDSVAATNDESRSLRVRRFDPAAGIWGWDAEQAVTTPPAGGARDLEPFLLRSGAGFRAFFSSDRGGGRSVWWTVLDAAANPGPLSSLPADPNEAGGPAAVTGPTGRTWLFSRSDRSISHGQVAMVAEVGQAHRSSDPVPDAGSLTLRSGSRTLVLGHTARLLGRRHWGDLLSYTIEHPTRLADDELHDTHFYTRRSIGVYLRQARNGKPITRTQIDRLLQVLRRFLPINLRLIVFIAPDPVIEFVYTAGADISDSYFDAAPLIEVLDGLADEVLDLLPDLAYFLASDLMSLSTSFGDLTTARRRTWFPDLN